MSTPSSSPNNSHSNTPTGGALETIPTDSANAYKGKVIPNTPLGASVVSVCLAITFTLGLLLFFRGPAVFGSGFEDERWRPLGFFLASWAAFHWGEYAVAAGWNRARCSVDCEFSPPLYSVFSMVKATRL